MANAISGVLPTSESSSVIKKWVRLLESGERMVSQAFASTFFSPKVATGRWIALALMILQPKGLIFGALGVLMTEFLGRRFSQNAQIRDSGIWGLNGLFAGMAVAAFMNHSASALMALVGVSFVTAMITIVGSRLLKTWDLPLLVLPYCVAIWSLQLISKESAVFQFSLEAKPGIIFTQEWLQFLHGVVLGFGQIFFSENGRMAVLIFLIVALSDPKRSLEIAASALIPSLIARLCLGPHWAIYSGLTSFSGILLFQAYKNGYVSTSKFGLWAFIGISGLFEVLVLRLSRHQEVFALSASYIGMFWLMKLSEEVRQVRQQNSSVIMTW